jgi:glucosamine--fructose-6-phosphate aminotransferase (isomerizing)
MCGIVGYVGPRPVLPILIEGLRKLEYRGYDSAGVALISDGEIELRRSAGKLSKLEDVISLKPFPANVAHYGVGHTRWATHGRPTEENAHPHRDCTGRIVVVHNGIIENYLELKRELIAEGHTFITETDTEVVAHLVEKESRGDGLLAATRRALKRVRGLFALVLLSSDDPDTIIAVRNGPPVVAGVGDGEYFIASDIPAILAHTRNVVFLDDQEVAIITRDGVRFEGFDGVEHTRETQRITWDPVMAEKAGYKHFMLKEIHEQPWAVRETVLGRASAETGRVYLSEMLLDDAALKAIDRVVILACGTSWHSGLVGKFLIEELARVPVEVDYGSEYRYRDPIAGESTLAVVITQSGETADTLAALREAKGKGAKSIAICNVVGSMATRESDGTVYTHAGPEIGVASTKAFTTQLVALQLLAVHIAQARGTIRPERAKRLLDGLDQLPVLIEHALKTDKQVEAIAKRFYQRSDFLYIGRGINYPIALEGALKLKEISYIHAEGYPAGEMKHGPIALIDEQMPLVALVPNDAASENPVFEKMMSNIQEAKARGGTIIVVTTASMKDAFSEVLSATDEVIVVPDTDPLLMPVLMVVPLQLLSYHIAVRRGCDVDQPRNLAKSVTVE